MEMCEGTASRVGGIAGAGQRASLWSSQTSAAGSGEHVGEAGSKMKSERRCRPDLRPREELWLLFRVRWGAPSVFEKSGLMI